MKALFIIIFSLASLFGKSAPVNGEVVSPWVLESFQHSFARAEQVYWSEGKEFYKAEFIMAGQYLSAFFTKDDGELLAAETDANGAFNIPLPSEGTYKVELKFPYSAGVKWGDNLLNTAYIEGNPTVFKYEVRLNDGDCNYSFFEVLRKTQ